MKYNSFLPLLSVKCQIAIFFVLVVFTAGCAVLDPEQVPESGMMESAIGFYQGPLDHLHSVRSGHCIMHPSCSQYAKQAVAEKKPLSAWFSICDRLIRCGRDLRHPDIRWVQTAEGLKVADSVHSNDH